MANILVFRIVATPGRFLHVMMEMDLKLASVEYVVFDEADRYVLPISFARRQNCISMQYFRCYSSKEECSLHLLCVESSLFCQGINCTLLYLELLKIKLKL